MEDHKKLSEPTHLSKPSYDHDSQLLAASEGRTEGGEQASVSGQGAEGPKGLHDANQNQEADASNKIESKKGVGPCNTPPSTINTYTQHINNIEHDDLEIILLKFGIDSIYNGYVVENPREDFYKQIKPLKLDAQAIHGPLDLCLRYDAKNPGVFMNFNLEPKGRRNYPYVIWNDGYTLQVFGEGSTGFNPRVYVEIRSALLEAVGEYHARMEIEKVIEAIIGKINKSRSGVSRLDVYADLLLDKSQFTDEIEKKLRCKSRKNLLDKEQWQARNTLCRR